MNKCVFFDRDGIVNVSPGPGYVHNWDEFRLMSEFPEALSICVAKGYLAIIVTNQRGIATGKTRRQDVDDIHRNLISLLKDRHNLALAAIYMCPHDNDCRICRKPAPGMFFEAAKEHDIDLSTSWMIGDSERDVQAGNAAGCKTILVSELSYPTKPDFHVTTMKELVSLLPRVLA